MTTATASISIQAMREATAPQQFPPLALETRTHVTTEHAAYLLGRRPQTMRCWAMRQHPIRAVNVNGRLAWPVAEIKRLMGVA